MKNRSFQNAILALLLLVITTSTVEAQITRLRAMFNGSVNAQNEIVTGNAATEFTVGFQYGADAVATPVAPPNLKIYYTTDESLGTDFSTYENEQVVDRVVYDQNMTNMFFRLTNLTPATRYYFIIDDGVNTTSRYFVETVSDDNDTRLSIIAGGDSRNAITADVGVAVEVPARQTANLMVKKLRADAVFFGGDMTLQDTPPEWFLWLDHWQGTFGDDGRITPIIAARGNHEYFPQSVHRLFDSPNADSFFGVKLGGDLLHLSTLNSETTVFGGFTLPQPLVDLLALSGVVLGDNYTPSTTSVSDQGTWLEQELADNACSYWKMAQYHRPTRPHEASKSLQDDQRDAWSSRFDKYAVQLVCESDAHVAKFTHPIRIATPAEMDDNDPNYDNGFIRDDANGTTYIGEGGWGAEIRSTIGYKWSINHGTMNQIKWLFIDKNKIEVRNIATDDAATVPTLTDADDRFDPTPFDALFWRYDPNNPNETVLTITNVTPPTEMPSLNDVNIVDNNDGTFTLTAPAGYANYSWNDTNNSTTQAITVPAGTYNLTVSNRALCTQTLTIATTNTLPIELINFSGEEAGKFNELSWTTSREYNNDFFVVEASTDGKNFKAIGQVAGAGISNETNTYLFRDASPMAQTTFYRLQQVDYDGKVTTSELITIKRQIAYTLHIQSITPNPVSTDARIAFTTDSDETIDYQIVSITGQIVASQKYQPTIGNNQLPMHANELTNGVYFIVLKQGAQQTSYRFMKK